MYDNAEAQDLTQRKHPYLEMLDKVGVKTPGANGDDSEAESCPAYGFLRGLRERAESIELRFRNGNTEAFPYAWLGPVCFNPSVGVLLKFSGDNVYLVLIRGSNLDLVLPGRAVNLIDRGILRHRILWVREMSEQELRTAGKGETSIDEIKVAEFESQEELRGYLKKVAPAFLHSAGSGGSG